MPILNKFRIRTPFEEFENYLGEEMNAFSGFFEESKKENEAEQTMEDSTSETIEQPVPVAENYWSKIKSFFKKAS